MKRLAAQGSQAGKPALYKIVKRFYAQCRKEDFPEPGSSFDIPCSVFGQRFGCS